MRKRLLFKLIIICLITLILTSCTASQDKVAGDKKQLKFGVTFFTFNNPYCVELNDAMKEVIESKGDKLITFDGQLNITKQISDIEDMIQQGCDLIFLNPVDWKGIKPALDQAQKANVPVIVIDTPVFDDDLVVSTIASDNYKAGVLCGESAVKKMNGKASVAIIEMSVDKSAQDRSDGFKEVMSKNPGMKIVAIQDGNGAEDKGLEITENMMQSHPEINILFGINDPTAIGAIAALESAGKIKDVAVLGVDGSDDAKKLIKEGKMYATAAQFPKEIGKVSAEKAYEYLSGSEIEHDIPVKVELIDPSNVDEY
jgi:ribose transport system substrate-binding protein